MHTEIEELCRRYEAYSEGFAEIVTELLERLATATEMLADALAEICDAAVDEEDTAEKSIKISIFFVAIFANAS